MATYWPIRRADGTYDVGSDLRNPIAEGFACRGGAEDWIAEREHADAEEAREAADDDFEPVELRSAA